MTGSIKDPKFYKCEIRNNGEYVYEASGTSFLPVSSITEEVILGEKAQYGTNHKLYKFDALKGVKTFLFEKTRDNSRKSAK
uniref:Uncharacterized protein n=1 Tax=Panagrolaimus davidi TaxID=227884 RepID=A0A914PYD1_9BILA